MADDIKIHNELEKNLMATHQKQLSSEAFVISMLHATVYVLSNRYLESGETPDPDTRLLLLKNKEFNVSAKASLAVFTSAPRADAFRETGGLISYDFTMATEAIWVFATVPEECGVVVNPNDELSFILSAQAIDKIRRYAKEQCAQRTEEENNKQ